MPWKFLVFLVFLAIVILFAGINVANSSDINLGFYSFEDVPIFVALGSAYMLGALSILPFALTKAFSKRRKLSSKYKERNEAEKQKYRRKAARKGGDGPDSALIAESTGAPPGKNASTGKNASKGLSSNETLTTPEQNPAGPAGSKPEATKKGLFRKKSG